MKVFIVSTGALYNWIIEGVFSSREKAEDYINATNGMEELSVDEYEVDSEVQISKSKGNG